MAKQSVINNNTIWSWLFKLLSTNFLFDWLNIIFSRMLPIEHTDEQSSAIILHESNISSYQFFLENLPASLMTEVLTFLTPRDIQSTLLSNRLFFKKLQINERDYLINQKKIEKFRYFIAIEAEDNQNKAEGMLQAIQDSQLVFSMLLGKSTIRDAAGRVLSHLSAYGYAFWSGDTRMRHMMEKYMNEETKALAYKECIAIATDGISFRFEGETINDSKHFDFQPLLNAYTNYCAEITPLIQDENWDDNAWVHADNLWLKIGCEQAKVPTHIAHEYCSNHPFVPIPTFKKVDFKRTAQFYSDFVNRKLCNWTFSNIQSGLGSKYSILKGNMITPTGEKAPRCPDIFDVSLRYADVAVGDLQAITVLAELRTVNDRNESLEDLKTAGNAVIFPIHK